MKWDSETGGDTKDKRGSSTGTGSGKFQYVWGSTVAKIGKRVRNYQDARVGMKP